MNLHAPNRLMGRQPWQWNIEAHRSIQRRAVANRTCELITHLAPWYTPSGWWTRPLKTGRKIPKVDIFFTNPQHIAKHWIWELQQDVSWCLTPSVARRRPKMPSGAVQGSTRRRRCRPNVNHRGRAMPGKKICLWNSSMMSRCLDFYGVFLDLILLFSWSVFVLLCLCVCVCSPQRHLRNSSESGRWCWTCFYLDVIWEDIWFWETKDWRCWLQVCFQLNQSGLRLKVGSQNANKGSLFFCCTFCHTFVVDGNSAHLLVCLSKVLFVICLLMFLWFSLSCFEFVSLCFMSEPPRPFRRSSSLQPFRLGRAGGKPFPSAWTRRKENISDIRYRIFRIFLRRVISTPPCLKILGPNATSSIAGDLPHQSGGRCSCCTKSEGWQF